MKRGGGEGKKAAVISNYLWLDAAEEEGKKDAINTGIAVYCCNYVLY